MLYISVGWSHWSLYNYNTHGTSCKWRIVLHRAATLTPTGSGGRVPGLLLNKAARNSVANAPLCNRQCENWHHLPLCGGANHSTVQQEPMTAYYRVNWAVYYAVTESLCSSMTLTVYSNRWRLWWGIVVKKIFHWFCAAPTHWEYGFCLYDLCRGLCYTSLTLFPCYYY